MPKSSDDRMDRTAHLELDSLLARQYTIRITPAHGMVGNLVEVFDPAPPHALVAEGRAHVLSTAVHRAYQAVEDRGGK